MIYVEKRECWKTLFSFLDLHSPNNIITARDLNIVLDTKEKRGGSSSRDQMLHLVEGLVHQWDLMDFKPRKGLYTWSNNRVGEEHISARLDRFLVQVQCCWKGGSSPPKFSPSWPQIISLFFLCWKRNKTWVRSLLDSVLFRVSKTGSMTLSKWLGPPLSLVPRVM